MDAPPSKRDFLPQTAHVAPCVPPTPPTSEPSQQKGEPGVCSALKKMRVRVLQRIHCRASADTLVGPGLTDKARETEPWGSEWVECEGHYISNNLE